jgi:hypothetical protein
MGGVITFFFFFERERAMHSLAHYQFLLEHLLGPSPSINGSTLFETPVVILKQMFIYMGVELWANHMG